MFKGERYPTPTDERHCVKSVGLGLVGGEGGGGKEGDGAGGEREGNEVGWGNEGEKVGEMVKGMRLIGGWE